MGGVASVCVVGLFARKRWGEHGNQLWITFGREQDVEFMIVQNVNCARRRKKQVPGQHICNRAFIRDAVIGFNVGFVFQFKGLPFGNHSIMHGIAQPVTGK